MDSNEAENILKNFVFSLSPKIELNTPYKLLAEKSFDRFKQITMSRKVSTRSSFCSFIISPIHNFVNIPALLLKNTLRFPIRARILTKVWIRDLSSLDVGMKFENQLFCWFIFLLNSEFRISQQRASISKN